MCVAKLIIFWKFGGHYYTRHVLDHGNGRMASGRGIDLFRNFLKKKNVPAKRSKRSTAPGGGRCVRSEIRSLFVCATLTVVGRVRLRKPSSKKIYIYINITNCINNSARRPPDLVYENGKKSDPEFWPSRSFSTLNPKRIYLRVSDIYHTVRCPVLPTPLSGIE